MCRGERKVYWFCRKLLGSSIKAKRNSELLAPVPEMASQYMLWKKLDVRNSLQQFNTTLEKT